MSKKNERVSETQPGRKLKQSVLLHFGNDPVTDRGTACLVRALQRSLDD